MLIKAYDRFNGISTVKTIYRNSFSWRLCEFAKNVCIIVDNFWETPKTYGSAKGVSFDGTITEILVSEIEKVNLLETKKMLGKVHFLQIWVKGNNKVIELPYAAKYYGEKVNEIYSYLKRAAQENAERIIREKEEAERIKAELKQWEEEQKKKREDMLSKMSPKQRQDFQEKERKEEERNKQASEKANEAREERRKALKAQSEQNEKDRQIKELTEQLKIANQRAASSGGQSGTKDIVKGAAAGWIIGGPVGGIIGAIVGKDKADSKR